MKGFFPTASAPVFAMFPKMVPHTEAFHAIRKIAPLPRTRETEKHKSKTLMLLENKPANRLDEKIAPPEGPPIRLSCSLNKIFVARVGIIVEKNANAKNMPKNAYK